MSKRLHLDVQTYNRLVQLIREYYRKDGVTKNEFIAEKVSEQPQIPEDCIENFVVLITHEKFLKALANEITCYYHLKSYKEERIVTFIFFIIFVSFREYSKELFVLIKNIECVSKRKIMKYFLNESNLITAALCGCKFYEDQYVLNYIINPILNKSGLLKTVEEEFVREEESKRVAKPLTVPDHMMVLQKRNPSLTVPLNTPAEYNVTNFQAGNIPKTLYFSNCVSHKLAGEYEKNKVRAKKLLEQAKNLQANYCKSIKREIEIKPNKPEIFKAKKAPLVNNVEIKGNIAAVLREAKICIKEQEEEIKNIESIVKGGTTLEKFKELEDNSKILEREQFLQDIEKKHLLGLLTFEEAILAKKKLFECNKERFKEFMNERQELLAQLQAWKEKEQEKIKSLVKKAQEITRGAKNSEQKLKEDKKVCADMVKKETRHLLQKAYEKQQDELLKRMKLIEEIRTLHQFRRLHQTGKEFDPSECPNFGLLCEMSISELQDSLSLMKMKMKEQLEQKRKCIRQHKEERRQMFENVKHFIAQTRMSKPKSVPIRPTKLERTSPDLDKLRSQLEYVRELRKNC